MDEIQGENEARKEAVLNVLPPRTGVFNAVARHENSFSIAPLRMATRPSASPV